MKKIILLATLCLTQLTHAVIFEVTDICEDIPILKEDIQVFQSTTVGHLTKYTFDSYSIPYIGSEMEMHSILNTPFGRDAIQFLAPNTVRVYGWCFEINGMVSSLPTYQSLVSPHSKSHIRWFFGYAERQADRWGEYCKPAYEMKDGFMCLQKK